MKSKRYSSKAKLSSKSLLKYEQKVRKILEEHNFIINQRENNLINERVTNGRRYFYMTCKRNEDGKIVDRFIKVPQNNTKKLLLPFERQIEVAKFIKEKNIIPTRGVINSNTDPKKGSTFAIMETFPIKQDKIGFIEDNIGVETFDEKTAKEIIDQLLKFHAIPIDSLPKKLKTILKKYPSNFKHFRSKIFFSLNKKVHPLDYKGKELPFYKVIENRIGILNIKNKIKMILDDAQPIIESIENKKNTLIHGDFSPNNLYVFDSGKIEFLDLEWVGTLRNSAIAMIRDFGNFRARSWINSKFRKYLDSTLVNVYKKNNKEVLGETIVKLSILRTHILFSSYFENYEDQKQSDPIQIKRRIETESDLRQIFES